MTKATPTMINDYLRAMQAARGALWIARLTGQPFYYGKVEEYLDRAKAIRLGMHT